VTTQTCNRWQSPARMSWQHGSGSYQQWCKRSGCQESCAFSCSSQMSALFDKHFKHITKEQRKHVFVNNSSINSTGSCRTLRDSEQFYNAAHGWPSEYSANFREFGILENHVQNMKKIVIKC
jgi:hypothetical protein